MNFYDYNYLFHKFFKSCSIFNNLSFNSFCSSIKAFFFLVSSLIKGELKYFWYATKKTAKAAIIPRAPIIKIGDEGKS